MYYYGYQGGYGYNGYPCCGGFGGGYPYGGGCGCGGFGNGAAIILVLFILLVIVIGARVIN